MKCLTMNLELYKYYMAKKYYRLDYLESFIGKEFIAKDHSVHLKILSLTHSRFSPHHFDTHFFVSSHVISKPLVTMMNGAINIETLKNNFVEKTKVLRVLFDPKRTNKKRGD